jgi:hypothetical protein
VHQKKGHTNYASREELPDPKREADRVADPVPARCDPVALTLPPEIVKSKTVELPYPVPAPVPELILFPNPDPDPMPAAPNPLEMIVPPEIRTL